MLAVTKRVAVAAVACVAASVFASAAGAVPPQLLAVGHENRHPTATFAAPRADSLTVYIASKPDRATDGSFFRENIETADSLETSEIQAGRWLDDSQIDPGNYWVMLHASPDFASCYIGGSVVFDPACAHGYSELVTLTVPKPNTRYRGAVRVSRFLGRAELQLTATPLGERVLYQACYRLVSKKRRCVRGSNVATLHPSRSGIESAFLVILCVAGDEGGWKDRGGLTTVIRVLNAGKVARQRGSACRTALSVEHSMRPLSSARTAAHRSQEPLVRPYTPRPSKPRQPSL